MVARDDSVIRGSLIACMIFLVLSLALNYFLWRWGDTQAADAESIGNQLQTTTREVRSTESKLSRLKAMMGVGGFTAAQIEEMKQASSEDPDMQIIEDQFVQDMSSFGPEVDAESQNYHALPEYLLTAIRSRNKQYSNAQSEMQKIRVDALAKIDIAEKAQELSKQNADDANRKAERLSQEFAEERNRINQEKEETRDRLQKTVQDINVLRRQSKDERNKLTQKNDQLIGTIENQKKRLNVLQSDRFENPQGLIRYVVSGGNIVTINLGSADQLQPSVTFGVIDRDETRFQDAEPKASIQVISIEGPHLALARVVAFPEVRNPIIPGDKIYSPYWAPGRRVKIALAGEIDIDGDGKSDNEAIKGQILAAGGEIAAEVLPSGTSGKLDASVRFLVVGDTPTLTNSSLESGRTAETIRLIGEARAKAGEFGITIIPAWKLQGYLKTIDDTLTTPLASAAKAEDFEPISRTNRQRIPTDIADIYKRQKDNIQKGKQIVRP